MKKDLCPKTEKCPIFIGGVLQRPESEEIYRKLYCRAGKEKYGTCKRYIVSNMTGKKKPVNIMPNCYKTIAEIVDEVKDMS